MRVKIAQIGQEFDNFDEIIKKTVNAEVKAFVRPRSYIYKIDQYCTQASCGVATKFYTSGLFIKDLIVKVSKTYIQEPRLWKS